MCFERESLSYPSNLTSFHRAPLRCPQTGHGNWPKATPTATTWIIELAQNMPPGALMKMRTGRPRHILIVDDETFVRQSVQILLQGDGYVVHEARSGAEALAMFEPGKFEMVFADYFMPGMKGDQLAAAIKERSPSQPVVMITAFLEKFQAPVPPPGGVDSIIGKPFELETLRSALARHAPS